MAASTDKIIPGLVPPGEETEGVDFLAIYDSFDAETLTDEQLLKFAPKYPLLTGIGGKNSVMRSNRIFIRSLLCRLL